MEPAGANVMTLEWEPAASAEPVPHRPQAGLDLLRFHLRHDAELVHVAGKHRWRWQHRG